MAASSGVALFDRRCRLTIANPVNTANNFRNTQTTEVIEIQGGVGDDRAVNGMRVQFEITKKLKKEPNTSKITVTNLSPTRRASIQKKGVKVLFEAGYKHEVSRIFTGDVRTVDHVRNGADWETVLQLGDGERAWQFARVNQSFSKGTRVADVLRTIASAMGLELGNIETEAGRITARFESGFAAYGSASQALDQVVRTIGKEWSIQDGALQILDPYQHLNNVIPDITPQTGLIGSPEMGSPQKKGGPALVKFKVLLMPIKPGDRVKLKSERYDGHVRVVACQYQGDTHGGTWETEISGEVLK